MIDPVYTLEQLRAAAAAADYGYEEFCRRLGLPVEWDGWSRNWPMSRQWFELRSALVAFTPDQLARLLADERPWTAEEILAREG